MVYVKKLTVILLVKKFPQFTWTEEHIFPFTVKCCQVVSFFTGHMSTKRNVIHQWSRTLLHFKHALHVTRYCYVTWHLTAYDCHLPAACKWQLQKSPLQHNMANFCRILRENTEDLRVTATKLIFIPRNKQQPHHAQKIGATELCDMQGILFSRIGILMVFRQLSK
jgi:hypothetical protein